MAENREVLHAVRGSVEVARSMVERSGAAIQGTGAGADLLVERLRDALKALCVVAETVDRELRRREALGPAA